jgi:hypothetical protein
MMNQSVTQGKRFEISDMDHQTESIDLKLMKQSLTESTNASMPQCLNQSINQSMKMI